MQNTLQKEHNVLHALYSAFGHHENWQISPLKGGLSGTKIFIADSGRKKYVVRFFNHSLGHAEPVPFAQRISNQKAAAEADYGPKIYWDDPEIGVIVMDYLQPQSMNSKTLLSDLAILLNKIHKSPPIAPASRMWTQLYKMINTLKGKTEAVINLPALKARLDTLVHQASHNLEYKTCHRDLHPGNLIFSQGQFFAVDYDTIGVDDPYIDIAKIANFYCYTPESQKELLALYLHRQPTIVELDKLATFKKILFIFSGVAFLQKVPTEYLTKKPELMPLQSYTALIGTGKVSLGEPREQLKFSLILIDEGMSGEF